MLNRISSLSEEKDICHSFNCSKLSSKQTTFVIVTMSYSWVTGKETYCKSPLLRCKIDSIQRHEYITCLRFFQDYLQGFPITLHPLCLPSSPLCFIVAPAAGSKMGLGTDMLCPLMSSRAFTGSCLLSGSVGWPWCLCIDSEWILNRLLSDWAKWRLCVCVNRKTALSGCVCV